jgi:hypothetical protein
VAETLEARTLVLQQRMLRRLPASLWNTQDLDTTQAKLLGAIAHELATWFGEQDVVRTCTLLQEAGGIDLDFLLRDYGLKRYNQRPDALARQLARQILWTAKGTVYSMQEVARLLVDTLQLLGRSGRTQPHWWVAQHAPLTFARTYWQFCDVLGGTWYLYIGGNEIHVSQAPPAGANITPWQDGYTPTPNAGPPAFAQGWEDVQALDWVRVFDLAAMPWYIRVEPDGGLTITDTAPPSGRISTQPIQLLDGAGEAWGIQVDHLEPGIILVPLTTPQTNTTYWRLRDAGGAVWIVSLNAGAIHLSTPPAPLGWQETTPGGQPLDWVQFF